MICVTDSGCGMTREVQARLFEPFFTTKPQGVGTGLGLATVYGIVKHAGGWIWVYSEVGRGSTFKIYLPRIDKPVSQIQSAPKTDIRGTETILVVEDQSDVRKLTVVALKKLGYKVHSASQPDEALALAQSFPKPIHLLLTDVVMPGMTGREMADRMTKLRPGLPVLFMSGYTDDAIVQYGVLEPGVAYIAKPFTTDSLGQKVRETIGPRSVALATSRIGE
jgi:CheY-like chemotaxis protein